MIREKNFIRAVSFFARIDYIDLWNRKLNCGRSEQGKSVFFQIPLIGFRKIEKASYGHVAVPGGLGFCKNNQPVFEHEAKVIVNAVCQNIVDSDYFNILFSNIFFLRVKCLEELQGIFLMTE